MIGLFQEMAAQTAKKQKSQRGASPNGVGRMADWCSRLVQMGFQCIQRTRKVRNAFTIKH
jgi:predicted mannosyl-3-phosphoglycerate phosphatase (HAD superfamily)